MVSLSVLSSVRHMDIITGLCGVPEGNQLLCHKNIITGLCGVPKCTEFGWNMNIIMVYMVSLKVLSSYGT